MSLGEVKFFQYSILHVLNLIRPNYLHLNKLVCMPLARLSSLVQYLRVRLLL